MAALTVEMMMKNKLFYAARCFRRMNMTELERAHTDYMLTNKNHK